MGGGEASLRAKCTGAAWAMPAVRLLLAALVVLACSVDSASAVVLTKLEIFLTGAPTSVYASATGYALLSTEWLGTKGVYNYSVTLNGLDTSLVVALNIRHGDHNVHQDFPVVAISSSKISGSVEITDKDHFMHFLDSPQGHYLSVDTSGENGTLTGDLLWKLEPQPQDIHILLRGTFVPGGGGKPDAYGEVLMTPMLTGGGETVFDTAAVFRGIPDSDPVIGVQIRKRADGSVFYDYIDSTVDWLNIVGNNLDHFNASYPAEVAKVLAGNPRPYYLVLQSSLYPDGIVAGSLSLVPTHKVTTLAGPLTPKLTSTPSLPKTPPPVSKGAPPSEAAAPSPGSLTTGTGTSPLSASAVSSALTALCLDSGTSMSNMVGCSLWAMCKSGKGSGQYCGELSLLSDICTDMPGMSACRGWSAVCGAAAPPAVCTGTGRPLPGVLRTQQSTSLVLSMCAQMSMRGCETCSKRSCPRPLETLAGICQEMPSMNGCSAFFTMCESASSSFPSLCGSGSDQTALPPMLMYFHQSVREVILFRRWIPTDTAGYVGSLIAVLAIGVTAQALKAWRSHQERKFTEFVRKQGPTSLIQCNAGRLSRNSIRALFSIVIVTLDYFLMLVAMTFNVGLFIAIILSFGLGSLLFGHIGETQATQVKAACPAVLRMQSENDEDKRDGPFAITHV